MQTDLYTYKTEPFEHQVNAVKFVSNDPFHFALFMEQGTGKTKTTIDILENLYLAHQIKQVLVIAPNGVHRQWGKTGTSPLDRGEIETHGFVPNKRMVWQSNKKNAKMLEVFTNDASDVLKYLCVNVEAFSLNTYLPLFIKYVSHAPTFIVVDEATTIKNPEAARTENITHGLSQCQRIGRRLVDYFPYSVGRCILTGTPEAKGPYGLWAMLEFVKKGFWGMNYYAFKARYGIERQVTFPGMMRTVRKPLAPEDFRAIRKKATEEKMSATEIAIDMNMAVSDVQYILDNPGINTPYKNLNELRAKLATISYTVCKKDCLDLPEKVYEVRYVPMSTEQARLYKEIKRDAYTLYQQNALDALNQAAIRTRLRQIAGGFFPAKYDLSEGCEQELANIESIPIGTPPKITHLESLLDDHAESLPAIVSCAFRAEAKYLYAELSKTYKCALIMGGIDKKERARIEDEFKQGQIEILVAVESTIAKGFNFQISHTMYMYSSTYNTEDRMQLEDRIHRYGQKEVCTYVDLITEDSIDQRILDVLKGDVEFQNYMRSTDPTDFLKTIE